MKIINDHLSSPSPSSFLACNTEKRGTKEEKVKEDKTEEKCLRSGKRGAPQKSAALCEK